MIQFATRIPPHRYVWCGILVINITIFQNYFEISAVGKASVSSYLTGREIDEVRVDASLQQYKNGSWTTIKSWTATSFGANAGLNGTYYVAKG